ncbi:MAG TPA: mercury(II) reductase [Candidatus Saccharimonadales bacterium]|nr:mercury(II) reductase [Candidatus Saccharimonadales bacterium]
MDQDMLMRIDGMTCAHCEKTVAEALTAAGARRVVVHWRAGTAAFDGAGIPSDQLKTVVDQAGYRVSELGPAPEAGEFSFQPLVGDKRHDYDLVVLGSGSAAFAAAITATESGARVALMEANVVGGTCVNVGCVPSKAMLAPADLFFRAGHHPFTGITTAATAADLPALIRAKTDLVAQLRKEKYLDLAETYGFTICHGRAEFVNDDTIECAGERVRARTYIVATGASPSVPPIDGLRDVGYLTSTTALELEKLPSDLIIIGANAIGLEMGQLFLHLGSRVTFIEVAPRITPTEEPETSQALQGVLEQAGAVFHTGATITNVARSAGRRTATFRTNGIEHSAADDILVATGRRPNTGDLGLERAGVHLSERGAVQVDGGLRTTNPRVFAAGDVTGHPQFVYVAAYEGSMAARNAIMGHSETVDFHSLPRVIFTSPTFAAAGLTDEQANAQGIDCQCRVLPMSAVPRALVNRDTRGFVKIVADATSGRIVGASAVADGAGDVIQAAVYAIQFGLTTEQVASTWAPYLTFAEGFKLAAQTFTRDVSKLSCCAA